MGPAHLFLQSSCTVGLAAVVDQSMSAGCMVPKLRFAYVYRVLWLSQIECVI